MSSSEFSVDVGKAQKIVDDLASIIARRASVNLDVTPTTARVGMRIATDAGVTLIFEESSGDLEDLLARARAALDWREARDRAGLLPAGRLL